MIPGGWVRAQHRRAFAACFLTLVFGLDWACPVPAGAQLLVAARQPGATPTPMAAPNTPPGPAAPLPRATATPTYQDFPTGPPPLLPPPPLAPAQPRRGNTVNYQPLATPPPLALPPGFKPVARPTQRPKPKPKPKPSWRPPRGAIYVDGSGVYPSAIRLRYGSPLRILQAAGVQSSLALVAVDPHEARTGRPRALTAFPNLLAANAKWTWLGDGMGMAHRHWAIAKGSALTVEPETFLFLHDEIDGPGVGYLWPIKFLFYVAAGGNWRRVIVTMDR